MMERLIRFHNIERMCRAFEVSRSGYYKYISQGKDSKRSKENTLLLLRMYNIWIKSRRVYGSPRIAAALRKQGYIVNIKRVVSLMHKGEIKAIRKKKYRSTTNSEHNKAVSENLLLQNFKVNELNKVWLSDITYIRTKEGFLYLAVVMDLCSRMPIGINMQNHMRSTLVLGAFQKAMARRDFPENVILHSDQGIQYASEEFRTMLRTYGVTQSMSRKGNCYDNAPMESFFHTLKSEMICFTKFNTRKEAEYAVNNYIEDFFIRIRLHSSLNYKSPLEFENDLNVS